MANSSNAPKISVIIPTYNVAPYLRQCMDSVVNQSLRDIEILCVNDGSTDESLSILQEYAKSDERVVLIDKPNSGYGDSMNRGLDIARGEYIAIVEPDDFIALNMYEDLYSKAHELNLDIIKSDFIRFVNDADEMECIPFKICRDGENNQDYDDYYHTVLNCQNDIVPFYFVMNTWSGIYKREFLNKFNIRHNTTPGASFQDNGFWFQTFSLADRMYFVDTVYYMNRRDNPNSSVHSKEKVYAMKHEYDYIRAFLDRNPELKKKFLGVYYLKKFVNYLATTKRIDSTHGLDFLTLFSEEFNAADQAKELDWNLFNIASKRTLLAIMVEPVVYFNNTVMNKAQNQAKRKSSWIKQVFSVRNNSRKTHRVVTIFGIKISFRRKAKV